MLDRRDPSRRRAVALAAASTLLVGGLAACSKDGPQNTVKDFLEGWRSGNLSSVGFVAADGSKISANDVVDQLHTLSGDLAKQSLVLTTVGEPKTTGDIASSTIKLDWTLPGGAPWSYTSTVRLTKQNSDGWRVVWEPAIVQSELQSGDKLGVRRVASKRAPIQDASGKPIVTPREVVTVGITPSKITNLAQLRKDLAAAFKKINVSVDMSNLADRVKNADEGAFIDLVTLRRPDYNKIRDAVRPLPGTVFREETRDLAPTRAFARALLGTADQATREDIDASPETIAQGDVVGHGGLQQRYDPTLRGTPGVSVVIAREAADGTVSDTQLFSTKPVDGKPVKITIDEKTQTAADAALATQKQPSSLVAIRVSDGAVLAVANGPDGGTVDTALTGQVPPGSTFKTVSAYGLLSRKAVTATSVVACPKTATVDGREFKNSGGEVLGNVQFHVDFAKSCNTAFVGLAPKLGAEGLREASAALGLGEKWDLGVEAFSGKVSAAGTPTELAAATFGQGATAVSPVAMASVAASVARGQFKQPKLLLDPAPAKPADDGLPLDEGAAAALRSMMREVVTGGTGTALKDVKGKPVFGKTGTAEFDEKLKDTHSWFIGYQGDVAFAVMVQKGGAGSEAAVPIVETFLNALNK
ncbi:penicillin-binding transpeptidase domain-containing protein [Paractinoplanes rhizophilus]|jgi:cell division protein FtsI/penicillin-binding protein 2|uniref:Penicillin-binding transpeptidase domain-containing protein n=1 Tax=Paractinoplanes rhizophilus TaxID=1416877 RepID=A0ABW2I160_9ACTN|nr:penicillin-binding transpeptidase domain-containing protein [Actinoplanes sp.]